MIDIAVSGTDSLMLSFCIGFFSVLITCVVKICVRRCICKFIIALVIAYRIIWLWVFCNIIGSTALPWKHLLSNKILTLAYLCIWNEVQCIFALKLRKFPFCLLFCGSHYGWYCKNNFFSADGMNFSIFCAAPKLSTWKRAQQTAEVLNCGIGW